MPTYEFVATYRYFDIKWSNPKVAQVLSQVAQTVEGVVNTGIVAPWTTRVWYDDDHTYTQISSQIATLAEPAFQALIPLKK